MPAVGADHAFRRRRVFLHRLAPQGSWFIPENLSDRKVSDIDQKTTLLYVTHLRNVRHALFAILSLFRLCEFASRWAVSVSR